MWTAMETSGDGGGGGNKRLKYFPDYWYAPIWTTHPDACSYGSVSLVPIMKSPADEEDERRRKKRRRTLRCSLVLAILSLVVGGLLAFGGLAVSRAVPGQVEGQIRQQSRLIEDTRLWENWLRPKYHIQMKIWTYSIRNPDEILTGSKPQLKALGPYTFDEKLDRHVLAHENGTVKYRQRTTYMHNENESCAECVLFNRIWVPNMVYLKFVETASQASGRAIASTLLSQTAFLDVSVEELLFDGYKDPFLEQICKLPFMDFICQSVLDLPERIGFFYGKNGTVEGEYEIDDGTTEPRELGVIKTWNGKKELPSDWWPSEIARTIRGTDGGIYGPGIDKNTKIEVFSPQLCRTIWLTYEREVDHDGIKALRFTFSDDVFDSSHEANDGFCGDGEKILFESQRSTNSSCLPKGLFPIGKCQKGSPPVVISLPNFAGSTDEVRHGVVGLEEPNDERDRSWVDIEPRLGVVIQGQRAMQVNVEMWAGKDITFPVNLTRMHEGVVPVLIMREEINADAVTLASIRSELYEKEALAYRIAKILLILGLVLATLGLLALIAIIILARRNSGSATKFGTLGSKASSSDGGRQPQNNNSHHHPVMIYPITPPTRVQGFGMSPTAPPFSTQTINQHQHPVSPIYWRST